MKWINFLLLTILCLPAIAANIGDDTVNIGQRGSSNAKALIFRDANSSRFEVEHASGDILYTGNAFSLGDGTASDKSYVFDLGLGANNPYIKWDNTKQKFRQSTDGVLDKDLGSGSGGGGGDNFNNGFTADDNANAEDGTTNWSETGGGTLAVTSTDPLEGDQSFTFTSSAQNDEVCVDLLDFDKDIFKGRSCEASIEYFGGNTNLDLLVKDGNGDILNSLNGSASTAGNNRTLPTHSISAPESVYFLCPTATAIAGDADKGDIKICINNVGASAAPIIKWDKSYVGTLKGLSETTLPDVVSFNGTPSGVVFRESAEFVTGNGALSDTSLFTYTISGFSNTPNCTCSVISNAAAHHICQISNTTPTSLDIRTKRIADGGVTFGNLALDHNVSCQKQGSDAKQSVQVYKSIPKISENINTFNAKISSTDVVSDKNFNWINGNCTDATTGEQTCTFVSGVFSVAPNCVVTGSAVAGSSTISTIISVSSSSILISSANDAGVEVDANTQIVCQKQGVDFKMPTVQPVIVGQTANSYAESAGKNVRTESCQVTNTGSPVTNNVLCDTWISSITDGGTASTKLNFTSGIFGGTTPVCVASLMDAADNKDCKVIGTTTTYVDIKCEDEPTGGNEDQDFSVICQGVK